MSEASARSTREASAELLNRVPLRDQVFKILRDMVISGSLSPGDRLNEAELAAGLGISRGPLREAIQRLGAEGFVEFKQNRGAFVRTLTSDDVRQMFEARELIEVQAARFAAVRATEEGILHLRRLLASAEQVLGNDAGGAYPEELDVHELVLELAGNAYLQRAGLDVQNQVRLARAKSGSSPDRARIALAEHREIISAISEGDADRAGLAMAKHLQQALGHVMGSQASEEH